MKTGDKVAQVITLLGDFNTELDKVMESICTVQDKLRTLEYDNRYTSSTLHTLYNGIDDAREGIILDVKSYANKAEK